MRASFLNPPRGTRRARSGAYESLHELPGLTDTGKLLFSRATLKIYDRPTLRAVIQGINELDLAAHDGHDFKGDMYEYLLSKLSASGTNGQFRTPRHIIDLIVELVNPQPGQRICDPAEGTAGFLISAFTHILRQNTKTADLKRGNVDGSMLKPAQWKFLEEQAFTGFDNDANMVKIAILNLYLHQLEKARIEYFNPLTTGFGGVYPGQRFDVILANPPFSGAIQKESVLADLDLPTRDTELLFVKWIIDHLADGGRAGIIVPDGVVTGNQKANQKLKDLLLHKCSLDAVISLPAGVFLPYARAKTSILIFSKGKPTSSVWFFDMQADGYTLDDKRLPIPDNDIPEVYSSFYNRASTLKSVSVNYETLRQNDFDLRIGKYFANPVGLVSKTSDSRETLNTTLGQLKIATEKLSAVSFSKGVVPPRTVPLRTWITRVERRVPVEADISYRLLGVKWYGEGPFLREELTGNQIKAKYLFRVEEGDIIYNRLFAWKGSFGMVAPELHGCFVSNEFPLFRVNESNAYAPYIKFFLKSAAAWGNAERLSTGTSSTSRNRLSIDDFLSMEIPNMTRDQQKAFVLECEFVEQSLSSIRNAEKLAAKLLSGLVSRFAETL